MDTAQECQMLERLTSQIQQLSDDELEALTWYLSCEYAVYPVVEVEDTSPTLPLYEQDT